MDSSTGQMSAWCKKAHDESQIYEMGHFSTQVESIVKLRFQILETKIDNTTATFLSALMLSEATSLALWFLKPTELLQNCHYSVWPALYF